MPKGRVFKTQGDLGHSLFNYAASPNQVLRS